MALVTVGVSLTTGTAGIGPALSATVSQGARAGVTRPHASSAAPTASTFGWKSTNWSGYAVAQPGVTAATGTWTVPTVTVSTAADYSASWVGVDGLTNSDLIQTGTAQDSADGRTSYYAWWEVLPAAESEITTMRVTPGNTMTASVKEIAAGSWQIVLTDVTTGVSFTKIVSYRGPGTSAEWIEEAPTVGFRQSTLADFGTVDFAGATINGASPRLVTTESGAMVNASGLVIAAPSAPNTAGNGFSDTYVGAVAPTTPSIPVGHGGFGAPRPARGDRR